MTEQEQFALLESVSENTTIFDAYEKAFAVLNDDRARTVCAIRKREREHNNI